MGWPTERGAGFPVVVCLRSIGVPYRWVRDQAVRLEAAGYAGVAVWDHFVSRGDLRDPVQEAWTTLSLLAGTTREALLMPYVLNVMNRHPAVVARMAATLQDGSGGRLVLGMGIGGHPAEHEAYGIPFPPAAERVERLTEAVAVIRALWTGGPVTRPSPFYPLHQAFAHPVPDPLPPIVIGADSRPGAALAARLGDGWTVPDALLGDRLPAYLDALAGAGRDRADVRVLPAFELAVGESLVGSPWVEEARAEAARWQAQGADGAIVMARSTADVDLLVEAAGR